MLKLIKNIVHYRTPLSGVYSKEKVIVSILKALLGNLKYNHNVTGYKSTLEGLPIAKAVKIFAILISLRCLI